MLDLTILPALGHPPDHAWSISAIYYHKGQMYYGRQDYPAEVMAKITTVDMQVNLCGAIGEQLWEGLRITLQQAGIRMRKQQVEWLVGWFDPSEN